MSTITIHPAARLAPTSRPRVPHTLRLTRRGRAVFSAGFLLVALVLMVVLGGLATATKDAGSPTPVRMVQVQPGDTLYGIASEAADPGDIRATVHRIQELNSLSGTLQVGETVAVPLD